MKIKLIAPHAQHEDTGSFRLLRINLPLLAALTPPGHMIAIVDALLAPDDLNQEVDLVGGPSPLTNKGKSAARARLHALVNITLNLLLTCPNS